MILVSVKTSSNWVTKWHGLWLKYAKD